METESVHFISDAADHFHWYSILTDLLSGGHDSSGQVGTVHFDQMDKAGTNTVDTGT